MNEERVGTDEQKVPSAEVIPLEERLTTDEIGRRLTEQIAKIKKISNPSQETSKKLRKLQSIQLNIARLADEDSKKGSDNSSRIQSLWNNFWDTVNTIETEEDTEKNPNPHRRAEEVDIGKTVMEQKLKDALKKSGLMKSDFPQIPKDKNHSGDRINDNMRAVEGARSAKEPKPKVKISGDSFVNENGETVAKLRTPKDGYEILQQKLEDLKSRAGAITDESKKSEAMRRIAHIEELTSEAINADATRRRNLDLQIRERLGAVYDLLPKKESSVKQAEKQKRGLTKKTVSPPEKKLETSSETPTIGVETNASAYEDDYTPKISSVEAVSEAIEEKTKQNFLDSIEKTGAFEPDYIPKPVSHEEIPVLEQESIVPSTPDVEDSPGTTPRAPSEPRQVEINRSPESDPIKHSLETRLDAVLGVIDSIEDPYLQSHLLGEYGEISGNIKNEMRTQRNVKAAVDHANFRADVSQSNLGELEQRLDNLTKHLAYIISTSTNEQIVKVPEAIANSGAEGASDIYVKTRKNQLLSRLGLAPSGEKDAPESSVENKANGILEKQKASRLERAKALGNKTLEWYQKIGDGYNKLPLKTKIAVSLGLTVATFTIGGVAVMAASTGINIASATGLSLTLERALAASYSEATGKERTRLRKIVHAGEAVSLAVLISFFGADAIKNAGEGIVPMVEKVKEILGIGGGEAKIITEDVGEKIANTLADDQFITGQMEEASKAKIIADTNTDLSEGTSNVKNVVANEVKTLREMENQLLTEQNLKSSAAGSIPPSSAESVTGNTVPRGTELISNYAVKQGDTLTKIIQERILVNSGLGGAKLTNATENILSAMRADPSKFGITSENLDLIKVGENIDIAKIKELADGVRIDGKTIIETANNLSPSQISNIENYSAHSSEAIKTGANINVPESVTNTLNAWSGEGERIVESIEKIDDEKIVETPTSGVQESGTTPASHTPEQNGRINSELIEQAKFKADLALKEMVESKYGSRGIFGFLKSDGMNIWQNIKDTAVADLDRFKSEAIVSSSSQSTNYLSQPHTREVTEKIIRELTEATGFKAGEKETIGSFVQRMIEETKIRSLTASRNLST